MLSLAASAKPEPMSHVLPHYLFGSTWFTNHHLMSLVVLVGGSLLMLLVARRMAVRPEQGVEGYVTKGRVAQLFETICVFLRDEMTRPLLGGLTDKYIYYIWSTFFFILFGNLLGMIPIGPVAGLLFGKEWSHIGGTMTGNLAFTGGLAVLAFLLMNASALKESGLSYIRHAFPVPMQPLYLSPLFVIINVFIAFMELIVSPVIRSFALAVRLFANMVAGHLVLGSLVILVIAAPAIGKGAGVLGSTLFSFLELFVAFLQAYVFTFLLVIFISLGVVSHGEHDEHNGGLDEGEQPGEALDQQLTGTARPVHA